MGVAMDGAEEAEKRVHVGTGALTGRALVREVLIRPLAALPRPKRVSAEQHAHNLEGLVVKLAHMGAPALAGICELALRVSGGKVCPDPAMIRAWALAIEPPPPQSSDYAQSVIRSAMGRRALDEGYAVELLRHAKRAGPPPQSYLLAALRDEAAVNRRRLGDIREMQAVGRASPEQLRWMQAWWDDLALCEAIQRGAREDEGTEDGKAA